MTINERIKSVRKHERVNLTMEEFGERLGVSKSTISGIESGYRGVTSQMKTAIVREFHVNPEWLQDEVGDMFAGEGRQGSIEALLSTVANAPDGSYIARMAAALSYLSADDWKHLCEIAEKISAALPPADK